MRLFKWPLAVRCPKPWFLIFEMFSLRKNQRAHETQADEFGLGLVAKRYGHTRGSIHFFQKMKDQSPENLKLFEKFASSHPLPEERIEQLQKWADEKSQNGTPLIPWPSEPPQENQPSEP